MRESATPEPTLEEVVEVIKKVLSHSEVGPGSELGNTRRWDSLRHVEVLVAVERHFGRKIEMARLTELVSVRAIHRFLCRDLELG